MKSISFLQISDRIRRQTFIIDWLLSEQGVVFRYFFAILYFYTLLRTKHWLQAAAPVYAPVFYRERLP